MRKTKSEGKTVGILIGLRNSQSVRNLFARLRIAQCICEIGNGCEFGNVVCEFGNVVCEIGKVVCEIGNAKFRYAFEVLCETNEQCIVASEFRNAN